MKKIIFVFVLFFIAIIIWLFECRKFYFLGDENCVTVWKTFGGKCYIIPYRYYGVFKPNGSYIVTTNNANIDMIWMDKSDSIIFLSNGKYIIVNDLKYKKKIIDYNNNVNYFNKLFIEASGSYNRYKKNVNVISIDIKENYTNL